MFTLHKCLSENCFPCNTTYLWCTCIALVRRKFALKKCVIISFHWLWKIAFMINIDLCVWVLLLNEVLSSYVFWSGFYGYIRVWRRALNLLWNFFCRFGSNRPPRWKVCHDLCFFIVWNISKRTYSARNSPR